MPKEKCVFDKHLQQAYPFLKQLEDASHLHCLKCGSNSISNSRIDHIRRHLKSKKHLKSIGATSPIENNSNFYIAQRKKERKPKYIELCRICSKFANASSATNLFDEDQHSLLVQITDLTNCLLRNENDLPKYICQKCEEDLQRAHSFRTICLDTQSYFSSVEYKERFEQKVGVDIYRLNEAKEMRTEEVEKVLIDDKEEPHLADPYEEDMLDISNECENKALSDLSSIKRKMECLSDINIEKTIKNNSDTDSQKLFQNDSSLNNVKKKPDFICDRCGNYFNSRQHLNLHLRRHSNNKPFKCELCPKQCFTSTELKRHMRCHTGERPFACQYCPRSFADYSTKVRHERTHTNERPYSCSQCEKAFSRSNLLRQHLLVHTGERAFNCLQCNKAFLTRTNLAVHKRSIMHRQMVEKEKLELIG